MRHLALAFPDEDVVWGRGDAVAVEAARDEFLFGSDLLVAPVVDMGETTRNVWLPPGEWVSFWDAVGYDDRTGAYVTRTPSSSPIAGGQVVEVAAPLGRTPLFVRAGTCLPLLPGDVDTLDTRSGFTHDDDVVTLAEGIDRVRLLPFAATCA